MTAKVCSGESDGVALWMKGALHIAFILRGNGVED